MSFSSLITAIEGDKPTFQDVSDILQLAVIGGGNPISLGTFAGSANTYTATSSPSIGAYATGQFLIGKINVVNTGASTLNIDGLGAKTIKTFLGAAVIAGQLRASATYIFRYDGTDLICLNPSVAFQTWTPTWGASGSMTFSSVTTTHARYAENGNIVHFYIAGSGTIGGTVSTIVTFTLPGTSVVTGSTSSLGYGYFSNSGSGDTHGFQGSATVGNIRKSGAVNYSAGACTVTLSGFYEKA